MTEVLNITFRLPDPTPRFVREVYSAGAVRLHQGDALALLPDEPAESVDCIVTDPAYWSLEKWRNIGTTTRLGGGAGLADFEQEQRGWFKTITAEELFFCLREFARLLRRDRHAWVMTDGTVLPYVQMIAENMRDARGRLLFDYVKPFPVLKLAKGGAGRYRVGMGYHGRGAHEFAVLLKKGNRPMEGGRSVPDILEHLWVGDAESKQFTPDGEKYPTAKPVSLYRQLLGFSAQAGETVLDCFAGSGTLVDAAADAGCNVVLCDRSERAIQTITARVLARHAGMSTAYPLGAAASPEPEAEAEPSSGMLF